MPDGHTDPIVISFVCCLTPETGDKSEREAERGGGGGEREIER